MKLASLLILKSFNIKKYLPYGIRGIAIIVSLLLSTILAKNLNPDDFGKINLVIRVSTIFYLISLFGLEPIIIKSFFDQKKHKLTIINAIVISFFSLAIISLLSMIIILIINYNLIEVFSLKLALFLPVTGVITCINSIILVSKGKVSLSIIISQLLSPLLLIITIILLDDLIFDFYNTLIIYVIVLSTVSLIAFFSNNEYRDSLKLIIGNFYFKINKSILKESLPIALGNSINLGVTFLDLMILSVFTVSLSEVGIYTVCLSLAYLPKLILEVSNKNISASVSNYLHHKNYDLLNNLYNKLIKRLILISILFLIIILVFGQKLLAIWGDIFELGYVSLIILVIGQCINLGFGFVGLLLNLSGYGNKNTNSSFFGLLCFMSASIFLIPSFGIIGAAIANSLYYVISNYYKYRYCRQLIFSK